jgi:hypothetical protein
MQDGDDLHQRRSPVHDHVLIHAEEQHIPAAEVGTLMAFARDISQALERGHQLTLNPVGDCQTRFSEQVTPNLPEIAFSFRRDEVGRISRAGAVPEPRRLVGLKTPAQPVPWYAFAPVELGQTAPDLGVDGFFVFLKPGLAFALYFQGVEEHVFHALESAAMHPLLNESLNLRTVDFDGHFLAL